MNVTFVIDNDGSSLPMVCNDGSALLFVESCFVTVLLATGVRDRSSASSFSFRMVCFDARVFVTDVIIVPKISSGLYLCFFW